MSRLGKEKPASTMLGQMLPKEILANAYTNFRLAFALQACKMKHEEFVVT